MANSPDDPRVTAIRDASGHDQADAATILRGLHRHGWDVVLTAINADLLAALKTLLAWNAPDDDVLAHNPSDPYARAVLDARAAIAKAEAETNPGKGV
jgi:hypothetical protein